VTALIDLVSTPKVAINDLVPGRSWSRIHFLAR
jgi:hypothetical protein